MRSFLPLTPLHLERLSHLAALDHDFFTRRDGRPEYRDRRVAVTLAQGAALHYVNRRNGVKDLDVWTFYAARPGEPFPAAKRETHADFGPSELGRQRYDLAEAVSPRQLRQWRRWSLYSGRRVDFMVRPLLVRPSASLDEVVGAIQCYLRLGGTSRASTKPSSWYLAQKAMVMIDPLRTRGQVIWPILGT